MNTQKPLKQFMTLEAYDFEGNHLPLQRQVINNSPAKELGVTDAIIIQYDAEGLPQSQAEFEAALEKFSKPVVVEGKEYLPFAWGSGIKDGKAIGLRSDLFAEKGILCFEEDTYRLGRAYFPNATAGLRGQFKVKAVPVGTVLPQGNKVDDGWGYIKRSVAKKMESSRKFRTIQMGAWQGSYSFLQRFEWTPALAEELAPYIQEGLMEIAGNGIDLISKMRVGAEEKVTFAKCHEEMEHHPYIANAVSMAKAERMFRVATTGGFLMQGGLFAPTTSDKLVLPGYRFGEGSKLGGDYDGDIITRYPIDSEASIQAVEAEREGDEASRLAEMEAVQYTLTVGFEKSFKGMLGIVDDEVLGDYDMVVSVEDLKLCSDWCEGVVKEESEYAFADAILSVTQWYAAGACIGVPAWLAKLLGADYDGDQGAVVAGEEFPEMMRQARRFRNLANPKLPKTKTPVEAGLVRAEKAMLSMANIVGLATNVCSTVLGVKDQEWIAGQLGWASADEMHEFFMLAIKVGTDIFKTSYDYRPIAKRLSQLSTRLYQLGVVAPWTRWSGHPVAFRHECPMVGFPGEEGSDFAGKNFILPDEFKENRQDAIIPELLRITLPDIYNLFDALETVSVKPLVYFRDWAIEPGGIYRELAQKRLTAYANRVRAINFSDAQQWRSYIEEWQAALASTIESHKLDAWQFANALWWLSHDGQRMSRLDVVASAVFVGMPEQAERIAAERPGLATNHLHNEVVVNGVKYQLPDAVDGLVFNCRFVSFTDVHKSGKRIDRLACVAVEPLPGQVQPQSEYYPRNTLGVLAIHEHAPVDKEFVARLGARPGKNGESWVCKLVQELHPELRRAEGVEGPVEGVA